METNKTYLVSFYVADLQVSDKEEISHEELMGHVNDYNYCKLHPDDWFSIHTPEGEELEISDFYKEAKTYLEK